MGKERSKYHVGQYSGGYPVYLDTPSRTIATFICEQDAIEYAKHATKMLWKHKTSDSSVWRGNCPTTTGDLGDGEPNLYNPAARGLVDRAVIAFCSTKSVTQIISTDLRKIITSMKPIANSNQRLSRGGSLDLITSLIVDLDSSLKTLGVGFQRNIIRCPDILCLRIDPCPYLR